MSWSDNELSKICQADDLKIAPFREDGATYGTPTWIWEVVVDGALYVRGYHGQSSRWYQAAIRQKAGRIIAAGMTREVVFEPVDGPINERIDAAYRAKYGKSQYLPPMVSAQARAATVKITPREENILPRSDRMRSVRDRLGAHVANSSSDQPQRRKSK